MIKYWGNWKISGLINTYIKVELEGRVVFPKRGLERKEERERAISYSDMSTNKNGIFCIYCFRLRVKRDTKRFLMAKMMKR